jgi:hypothetical protein
MRCAYCFRKITWSEWLFKGHINARCENKDEEKTDTKRSVKKPRYFDPLSITGEEE